MRLLFFDETRLNGLESKNDPSSYPRIDHLVLTQSRAVLERFRGIEGLGRKPESNGPKTEPKSRLASADSVASRVQPIAIVRNPVFQAVENLT